MAPPKKTATSWDRIILHADMDAFYAAVEQLDNAELRGKPVLVGGLGKRSVVSTASYEARPFGVGSAMPMAEARQRCPDAVVVPPNFPRYQEVSGRIMGVFRRMSPHVEPLSLDEAFIDMTGAETLLGTPLEMARMIKQQVLEVTDGLTVSVGVGSTKFVAKVASDMEKPDGLTIIRPREVNNFLRPLPISKIWGVGPRTRKRLTELGYRTIGDVADANEAFLAGRFGALGSHISKLSRGIDTRPVISDREAKSVGAELTLEEDIVGLSEVRKYLKRSATRVAKRLRREGLIASGIRVKLKTAEFQLMTRQTSLHPATDSARAMLDAADRLLEQFDLLRPMRLVGLTAFNLASGRDRQQGELFPDAQQERRRRFERTVDDLENRFGKELFRTTDEDD
jgi:DNA polymerase-4